MQAPQSEYSQAMADFQTSCQKYYVCYSFAVRGLQDLGKEWLANSSRENRMFVGTGHPNVGKVHAVMKIGEIIDASQPNGAFSDKIAKSFLTNIYAEWDEVCRPKLASEAKVDPKTVKSDLMGDIRLIRHCILHNKSMLTEKNTAFKELNWQLSPGPLVITDDMFTTLIDQINRMQARVEPANPSKS